MAHDPLVVVCSVVGGDQHAVRFPQRRLAELQRVQARYSAAGPELRPIILRQLKDAQRQYAKSSLAFLDFLDARDRRALTRYQEEIGRISRLLEEHARVRAELEKQLREE